MRAKADARAVAVLVLAGAATFLGTGAQAAASAAGACTPTTLVAQDVTNVPITMPPAVGTITAVQLDITLTGDISDLTAMLESGTASAGLLAGTAQAPTAGAALTYTDTATITAASLTGGAPLSGTVAPLEPFSAFHAAYDPAGWQFTALNLSDGSVQLVACSLMVTVDAAPAPTQSSTATRVSNASTSSSSSRSLASTGQDVSVALGVAAALLVVGLALVMTSRRRWRAGVASGAVVALLVGLSVTAMPTAARADEPALDVPATGIAVDEPFVAEPAPTAGEPEPKPLATDPSDAPAVAPETPVPVPSPSESAADTEEVNASSGPPVHDTDAASPSAEGARVAAAAVEVGPTIPWYPWGKKPDGSVVFRQDSNGLYTAPITPCGTNDNPSCESRLTEGDDDDPAFSPTGMQLAFVRVLSEPVGVGAYLHVLDLTTGAVTRLTYPETVSGVSFPRADTHPTWAPDEQVIVVDDGSGNLFAADPRSGTSQAVDVPMFQSNPCVGGARVGQRVAAAQDEWAGEQVYARHSPTFAPDGRLAYTRECQFFSDGEGELWIAPGINSLADEKPLNNSSSLFTGLDFGPDNQRIVASRAASSFDPNDTGESGFVDATSGAFTVVPELNALSKWSPAGTYLTVGDGFVTPSGASYTDYKPYCIEYWPDENGDLELYFTYCLGVGGNQDLQCAPGSCLSGLALHVQGWRDDRNVKATGIIDGYLDTYRFAKTDAGTFTVGLRGENATVTSVRCEDGDSTATPTSITARIADSEVVTCVVEIGPLHDRDGDGIEDQFDSCPDDATNFCHDADHDGQDDSVDPCPNDATNTCDPADPEDPADPRPTCEPYDVTIGAQTGGIQWFQSTVTGTVCPGTVLDRPRLTGTLTGEQVMSPSMAYAVDLALGWAFTYDEDASSVEISNAGNALDAHAVYDVCMPIIPITGALGHLMSKGLGKLLRLIAHFAPDRVVNKAVNKWMNALTTTVGIVLQGFPEFDDVWSTIRDAIEERVGSMLNSNDLGTFCIPVYNPRIHIVAGDDSVTLIQPDTVVFENVVLNSLNAVVR